MLLLLLTLNCVSLISSNFSHGVRSFFTAHLPTGFQPSPPGDGGGGGWERSLSQWEAERRTGGKKLPPILNFPLPFSLSVSLPRAKCVVCLRGLLGWWGLQIRMGLTAAILADAATKARQANFLSPLSPSFFLRRLELFSFFPMLACTLNTPVFPSFFYGFRAGAKNTRIYIFPWLSKRYTHAYTWNIDTFSPGLLACLPEPICTWISSSCYRPDPLRVLLAATVAAESDQFQEKERKKK